MIKVNLSSGADAIRTPADIPPDILEAARKFWGNIIPIFYTKRMALYSELIPRKDKKYLFLKIKQISRISNFTQEEIATNVFWCKNANILDFYKNDINNVRVVDGQMIYDENLPTSSEIFGFHRKDMAMSREYTFSSPADRPEHVVKAILCKDPLGYNFVHFYIDIDNRIINQEGVLFLNSVLPHLLVPVFDKPGSSGVKVPKGGAQ